MDARRVVLVLIIAGAVWNPSPVAAQSWSSNNSAAPASTYNRYDQPVAPTAPSITQRTQNAFTDSGTAIRDGVEAGIRAAEQGYNNVSGQVTSPFTSSANTNATTNAARGGVSSPWTNTNTTNSAASAPGWPSNASNTPPAPTTRTVAPTVTPIDGGWTSIGNSVAPPPLLIPQPPATTSNFGLSNQTTGTRTATNASAVTSNEIQPLHSVLADPSRPSASATTTTAPPAASPAAIGPPDNWATGWNDNATAPSATIGAGTRTSPAGTTAPAVSGSTVSKASDGWPDSNPWAQPSLGAASGTASANRPTSTGTATNSQFPTNTTQPTGQFAGQTNFQTPTGQPAGNFGMSGSNPNNSQTAMGGTMPAIERGQTKAATTEPQPWMPLIASVLVLAGSLAANLYLGVSYLDARQKYQSLVRKTADTFRRVKAVAA